MHKKYEKREHSSKKSRRREPKQEHDDKTVVKESKESPKNRHHSTETSRRPRSKDIPNEKRSRNKSNETGSHKVGEETFGKSRHKTRRDKSEKDKINTERYLEKSEKHKSRHVRENSSLLSWGSCDRRHEQSKNTECANKNSILNLLKSESNTFCKEKKDKKRRKESKEKKRRNESEEKKIEESEGGVEKPTKRKSRRKSRELKKENNELKTIVNVEASPNVLSNNPQILCHQIQTFPINYQKPVSSKRSKRPSRESRERKNSANSSPKKPQKSEVFEKKESESKIKIQVLHKPAESSELYEDTCIVRNNNLKKKKKRRDRSPLTFKFKDMGDDLPDEKVRSHHRKHHESSREDEMFREKVNDDIRSYFTKIQHLIDKKLEAIILQSSKSKDETKVYETQDRTGALKKVKRRAKRERDERLRKRNRRVQQLEVQQGSSKSSCFEKNDDDIKPLDASVGDNVVEHEEKQKLIVLKDCKSSDVMDNTIELYRKTDCVNKANDNFTCLKPATDKNSYIPLNPKGKKLRAVYYDYKGEQCDNFPTDDENSESSDDGLFRPKIKLRKKRSYRNQAKVRNLCKESFLSSNFQPEKETSSTNMKKLECRTISVVGISPIFQENNVVTNLAASSSLQDVNSGQENEELLEKRKKTKRFQVYYKYSIDNNKCNNSNEDNGIVSDSIKVASGEESDDIEKSPKKPQKHYSRWSDNESIAEPITKPRKKPISISPVNLHKNSYLPFEEHGPLGDFVRVKPENRKMDYQRGIRPLFSSSSDCCLKGIKSSKKNYPKFPYDQVMKNRLHTEEFMQLYRNNFIFNSDLEISVNSLEKKKASIQLRGHQTSSKEHFGEFHKSPSLEFLFKRKQTDDFICDDKYATYPSKCVPFYHVDDSNVTQNKKTKSVGTGPDGPNTEAAVHNVVVNLADLEKSTHKTMDVGVGADFDKTENIATNNQDCKNCFSKLNQNRDTCPTVNTQEQHDSVITTRDTACGSNSQFLSKVVEIQPTPPTKSILKNKTAALKTKLIKDQDVQAVSTVSTAKTVTKPDRKRSIALNTSLFNLKHRSEHSTTFTSLKTSRSETNVRNVMFNSQGGKVASLLCLHKIDHGISESTKSNSQSLEQYCLGSLLTDAPQKSTFFVTKDYKTSDLSSYQKRKIYDESIRRKMRRKIIKKQFGPQIYEVRFLTVDPLHRLDRRDEKTFIKNEFVSRIPVKNKKVMKKQVALKKQQPFVKREYMTTPVSDVDSLRKSRKKSDPNKLVEELFCNKSNFLSKSMVSDSSSLVTNEEQPCNTSTDNQKENFSQLVETICKIVMNCYKDNNIVQNCEKIQIERIVEAVKYQNAEEFQKKHVYLRNLSCPIFKPAQEAQDTMILGFALDNNKITKEDPTDSDSDETGYRSKSSSGTDFFKQPNIAALLHPSNHSNLTSYTYADIPEAPAEETPHDNLTEVEITMDCAVLENNSVESLKVEEVEINEPEDCPKTESQAQVLALDECNSLKFSNTNLNNSSITIIDPERQVDKTEPQKVDSELSIYSAKIEKFMTRKFFENLLALYEKEVAVTEMLYKDETFFEKELLTCIDKADKKKGKLGKKNLFKVRCKTRVTKWLGLCHCCQCDPDDEERLWEFCEYSRSVNYDHEEKIKLLARNARKHFSMLVQAVRINKEINDELKVCGLQKLLEKIENGQFTFLKSSEEVNCTEELKNQVKEAFKNVYVKALEEAKKTNRSLTSDDMKLIGTFVCKYRIGMLSKTDIIASHIGNGTIKTENDLKAAVTFLIRRSNIDLKEFEECCKLSTNCNEL